MVCRNRLGRSSGPALKAHSGFTEDLEMAMARRSMNDGLTIVLLDDSRTDTYIY